MSMSSLPLFSLLYLLLMFAFLLQLLLLLEVFGAILAVILLAFNVWVRSRPGVQSGRCQFSFAAEAHVVVCR